MSYFAPSIPNDRPTPAEVWARIARVNGLADSIARAKAASLCPGNAAYNGNTFVGTGEAAGANTGQGANDGSQPNYQGGGGAGGSMYDPDGGSSDYLQEIADAPNVQNEHNEPCPVVTQATCLAPSTPNPNWGNEWVGATMPKQSCAVGPVAILQEQSQDIPWWALALIAVGGLLAVREVLE